MNKTFFLMALALLGFGVAQANADSGVTPAITSPNGKLKVEVTLGSALGYAVTLSGRPLVSDAAVTLSVKGREALGVRPKLAKATRRSVDEQVAAPFHHDPVLRNHYNELDLRMKGGYGIRFRAYDEGIAYRWYTLLKDSVVIMGEGVTPTFASDGDCYLSFSSNPERPMAMAFQSEYTVSRLSKADGNQYAFLPLAVEAENGVKLVLTESDLEGYPGMFVQADPARLALRASFPPYPKTMRVSPTRLQDHVADVQPFIARCCGTRAYPWRVWAISEKDTELPTNNLVYLLASPNRIGDCSWVRPGKVAWDWWNDWGLQGVPFKAGINTETYKYYIDFASKYGLEYVVLDEGWYDPKSGDMLKVIPDIDLPELIAYGKKKQVGIVLWTVFNVLERQLDEACKRYSAMGVKGLKVDFMDRNDQTAVERTYRMAPVAARYHLFLDLHGFYTPTGLERTFPNILNFEGVFGEEDVKWGPDTKDFPRYNVTFPYLRMMCGPVDYTPGAMRNDIKSDWKPAYYNPRSQGTRCQQAACYVCFDAPFEMLCDAPTRYEAEPQFTQFLASIPVTWDETRIVAGRMGQSIVTARRKGQTWYVGALTDWTARTLPVSLSFLTPGRQYRTEWLQDGPNAARHASDYRITSDESVGASTTLTLHLAPGGGAVIKILPRE